MPNYIYNSRLEIIDLLLQKLDLAPNKNGAILFHVAEVAALPHNSLGVKTASDYLLKLEGKGAISKFQQTGANFSITKINPDALLKERGHILADGLLAAPKDTGQHTNPTIPNVYYNQSTGIGYANDKRFKFKNDQPEFAVFKLMYNKINNPVPRQVVLELAKQEEIEGDDLTKLTKNTKRKTSIHTSSTYFLNELMKEMRERTGLTKDQLVNNNGDFTLVGNKLETPPK